MLSNDTPPRGPDTQHSEALSRLEIQGIARSEVERVLKRHDLLTTLLPALIAIVGTLVTYWAQGAYEEWKKSPGRNINLVPISFEYEPRVIAKNCRFDIQKLKASRFSRYLISQPTAVTFYEQQWAALPTVQDRGVSSLVDSDGASIAKEFKDLSINYADVKFFAEVSRRMLLPIYHQAVGLESEGDVARQKWEATIEKNSLTISSTKLALLDEGYFEKLRDRQVFSDCNNRNEFRPSKPEFSSIAINLQVNMNSDAKYWITPSCLLTIAGQDKQKNSVDLPVSVRSVSGPSIPNVQPSKGGSPGEPDSSFHLISSGSILYFVWTPQLRESQPFDVGEKIATVLGGMNEHAKSVSVRMNCKLSTGESLTPNKDGVPVTPRDPSHLLSGTSSS